ncbi:uncharacterized protein LOC106173209 isoform X2 [Lingula anatina]|uniref:Uncharacterized protein LOC106173209 isoform X2 n=1 Tax=Lingula anatina TaxID=7574 RepID=A0A1S3JHW4_LINAN|nr:uncharacterized protein LOC106173209 isoform X2 [Lingula anatina]|eukprot:XP_013409726.1 uncharacterized protein LOC106173209 isoform X2 [Lingula anatina]
MENKQESKSKKQSRQIVPGRARRSMETDGSKQSPAKAKIVLPSPAVGALAEKNITQRSPLKQMQNLQADKKAERKESDPPLQFCGGDQCDDEQEVFFGDMSLKEKSKADKLSHKRRTMVYIPGFRRHLKLEDPGDEAKNRVGGVCKSNPKEDEIPGPDDNENIGVHSRCSVASRTSNSSLFDHARIMNSASSLDLPESRPESALSSTDRLSCAGKSGTRSEDNCVREDCDQQQAHRPSSISVTSDCASEATDDCELDQGHLYSRPTSSLFSSGEIPPNSMVSSARPSVASVASSNDPLNEAQIYTDSQLSGCSDSFPKLSLDGAAESDFREPIREPDVMNNSSPTTIREDTIEVSGVAKMESTSLESDLKSDKLISEDLKRMKSCDENIMNKNNEQEKCLKGTINENGTPSKKFHSMLEQEVIQDTLQHDGVFASENSEKMGDDIPGKEHLDPHVWKPLMSDLLHSFPSLQVSTPTKVLFSADGSAFTPVGTPTTSRVLRPAVKSPLTRHGKYFPAVTDLSSSPFTAVQPAQPGYFTTLSPYKTQDVTTVFNPHQGAPSPRYSSQTSAQYVSAPTNTVTSGVVKRCGLTVDEVTQTPPSMLNGVSDTSSRNSHYKASARNEKSDGSTNAGCGSIDTDCHCHCREQCQCRTGGRMSFDSLNSDGQVSQHNSTDSLESGHQGETHTTSAQDSSNARCGLDLHQKGEPQDCSSQVGEELRDSLENHQEAEPLNRERNLSIDSLDGRKDQNDQIQKSDSSQSSFEMDSLVSQTSSQASSEVTADRAALDSGLFSSGSCSSVEENVTTEKGDKLKTEALSPSLSQSCQVGTLLSPQCGRLWGTTLEEKKAKLQQLREEKERLERKLAQGEQKKVYPKSPLPKVKANSTQHQTTVLPRAACVGMPALALTEREIDAVTKLHTLCNSQQISQVVGKQRTKTVVKHYPVRESSRVQWLEDLVVSPVVHSPSSADQKQARPILTQKSFQKTVAPAQRNATDHSSPIVVSRLRRTNTLGKSEI